MNSRQDKDKIFTSSRAVLFILAATALIAVLYALQHTVSCFLLSFVIAYLLDPFVVMLEKRRIRRIYGILVLYAVMSLLTVIFMLYFFPLMAISWNHMIANLPDYFQKAKTLGLELKQKLVPYYGGEEWGWLIEATSKNIDKLVAKLGTGVYAAAASMVFNLFNLLLSPILVFFMLFYKADIVSGVASWLPTSRREKILELGREINSSIGGYIRGQAMVSVIVAVLSVVALMFLGVDYPVFNGVFAGLASIIPFVGVILATIPPLFFAYVEYQSGMILLQVIAAFSAIYFLEGYVIKPLVFKESMNLNPLVTIIVVMAFGELMGFWGILLAIPIAAAIKIVMDHLRRGDLTGEA